MLKLAVKMASATALPVFPAFTYRDDELSAGLRWSKYLTKFENLMVAMDINDEERKKALLIHYAGDEVFDLLETVTNDDKETYEKVKSFLTAYFTPKVNTTYESFRFRKLRQESGESIDQFHIRLATQAQRCGFHDKEREILTQIIEGTSSSKLRRKALRENLTLTQLLFDGRNDELTSKQANDFEKLETNMIRTHKSRSKSKTDVNPRKKNPTPTKHPQKIVKGAQSYNSRSTTCRYCGGNFPHQKSCPAKGKSCNNCGKINHFSKVCRSTNKRLISVVNQIDELTLSDRSSESSDEVFHITHSSKVPKPVIEVNDCKIPFVIDTGASVNILTEAAFQSLKTKPTLHPSQIPIFAYDSNSALQVIGSFEGYARYKKT